MVTRGWVLHTPRESAASMVATPLHGEIAPFRLISPPMKFPPQAVIGGSSPRPDTPPVRITVGGVPPTPPSADIPLDCYQDT